MPSPQIPKPKMPGKGFLEDAVKEIGEGTVDFGKKVGNTALDVVEEVGDISSDVIYTARTGDFMRRTEKLQKTMEQSQEQHKVAHQEMLDTIHMHVQALIERKQLSMVHEIASGDVTTRSTVVLGRPNRMMIEPDANLDETPTTFLLDQLGLEKTSDGILNINNLIPLSLLTDTILSPFHMITQQKNLKIARKQYRENINQLRDQTSRIRSEIVTLSKATTQIEAEIESLENEIDELGFSEEDHAPTMMRIHAIEREVHLEIVKKLSINGTDAESIASITGLSLEEVNSLIKTEEA